MAEFSATNTTTTPVEPVTTKPDANTTNPHRAEAKSRFNAALDEAKAGAAALKAEATERAGEYRTRAKGKGSDLKGDARAYGDQAKGKASELATDGKHKTSEAIISLSRKIDENATYVEERLGPKYGDYARNASRKLQETGTRLDEKSIDELTEDAREFIRRNPGTSIGIAAVTGYFLSKLFSTGR